MPRSGRRLLILIFLGAAALAGPSTCVANESPKTFLEELVLYGYVENSYVVNLGTAGRKKTNELRFYDADEGYTFNAAEISLRQDSSETRPFGFGVVITGGVDSQKNHSLGIFRDLDDGAPNFRDTPKVDLPEAYATYRVPVGDGLTLKAGKWATLIGYETYENPKNLNVSRSFLYTLGTPYTHTGALATYDLTPWMSVTAGFTNGWDGADNNNGYLRPTGSFVFTPTKTLPISVNWLFGPEQNRNLDGGRANTRWIVDLVGNYTGIEKLLLGLNVDIAGEEREPNLVAAGRRDTYANWGGIAGYVTYRWATPLRTALRLEYFDDADGARNGIRPAGRSLNLFEVTVTAEFKIWRGLMSRLEYRHDTADHPAFGVRNPGPSPTSRTQDTFAIALYYVFP